MLEIEAGGESLALLPEKAAWWPSQRTLLVADVHIGKAMSFRRLGVPVPRGTTGETLGLLSSLVTRSGARRVVFLGDFMHSRHSHAASTLGALARWRRAHEEVEFVLVRGNHDDRAGDPPPTLGFRVVDEPFDVAGLSLRHHPVAVPGRYVIAGHLHPCTTLGGRAHDTLRLPCFHVGPDVAVLPAFGSFTGMHPVRFGRGDRAYAVADGRVVALPA
jgi:DNA ligase-associated metallophosphoesterase